MISPDIERDLKVLAVRLESAADPEERGVRGVLCALIAAAMTGNTQDLLAHVCTFSKARLAAIEAHQNAEITELNALWNREDEPR